MNPRYWIIYLDQNVDLDGILVGGILVFPSAQNHPLMLIGWSVGESHPWIHRFKFERCTLFKMLLEMTIDEGEGGLFRSKNLMNYCKLVQEWHCSGAPCTMYISVHQCTSSTTDVKLPFVIPTREGLTNFLVIKNIHEQAGSCIF